MDYKLIVPVLISFAIESADGTGRHSVSEKTKDGTDRTGGRCTVTFEEGRNTDNGRCDHPWKCIAHFSFLYKRISEDHTGAVCDTWFWIDRISR